MARGRPLEGAPGWRVIERPRRQPWRAGYVIVPLAVCAGLFVALAPVHPDWLGWPKDRGLQESSPIRLTAREAELLEAAKAEVLRSLESRKTPPPEVPQDTSGAGGEPQPDLGRRIAGQPQVEATLPTLGSQAPRAAGSQVAATSPAGPGASDPIRVFIHHTMGTADAARAARLGAFLRSRGFTVAEIRSVDFDIDASSVRYFFDRDRAASRHLIRAVKEFDARTAEPAPGQLTDLTQFASKPDPGDVEIWLASRSAGWTRSAQAAPP